MLANPSFAGSLMMSEGSGNCRIRRVGGRPVKPQRREGRRATKPQPNFAKRLECVQLAGAVVRRETVRKREQAPRTPNASRGSSSKRTLAACEQFGLLTGSDLPPPSSQPYSTVIAPLILSVRVCRTSLARYLAGSCTNPQTPFPSAPSRAPLCASTCGPAAPAPASPGSRRCACRWRCKWR